MNSVLNYKFQLEQVEEALINDPGNIQLQQLAANLRQALKLAEELVSFSPVVEVTNANTVNEQPEIEQDSVLEQLKPGDFCEAQFSGDGIWYAARIDTISIDYQWFTVTYIDYGNSETLSYQKIRLLSDKNKFKRATDGKIVKDEKEAKKRKAMKFRERIERQESEQKEKQTAWLSFKTKATKKKAFLEPNKKSIFASADAIGSKVGVTNSGRGMTQFAKREKYMVTPQADSGQA